MKKLVQYDEALVTYLDILGFRELVQSETAGRISKTIRLVREALKPSHDRAKLYQMTYQNFSDLTVVSIPVLSAGNLQFRPGVLQSQIRRVANAQIDLLREGIVLRGAITTGSIVRSHGQLFDPALIKAYDLERTQAIYPRVVIDDVVFRELKRNPALTKGTEHEEREIMALLDRDEDQYWFIDYLSALFHHVELDLFRTFLRHHRRIIKARAREYERSTKVAEKYEWLASYHNRTIKKLGVRRPDSVLL